MRFLLTAFVVVALTGCTSSEETMCKANITNGLINPETVEFYDFQPLDADADLDTLWRREIVASQGIRLHYNNASVRNQVQPEIDRLKGEDNKVNATYATYRVKAESRVGLKVTQEYFCRIGAGECKCGPMAE
ncbi:hypothetical protein SAMN05518849_11667 [Sphingobium sp. AP50]|uniref:hypothetical protein n=1 Tax=Sphingobium sp. AP50 TaxID=1884369 RepID=UPI0008C0996A|nr:hypothetical protein [Sphingobium sp. AP50]SEJ87275.1 hypothetical protein SAMN05518849_11667 [Sphingobium sp. AP50]